MTLKWHFAMLPLLSSASQRTFVSPIGNSVPDIGSQAMFGSWPELSVALILHVTTAVGCSGSVEFVAFAGQTSNFGDSLSEIQFDKKKVKVFWFLVFVCFLLFYLFCFVISFF